MIVSTKAQAQTRGELLHRIWTNFSTLRRLIARSDVIPKDCQLVSNDSSTPAFIKITKTLDIIVRIELL